MGPAGGCGDLALGQQQPCPLRRDRVEQNSYSWTRRHPAGLAHRLQGSARITLGLPDPGQRRQAGGQRRGEVHPAAQRDALGDVPQGSVKLAPLVGHLRQAHLRHASGGQRRAAGRHGDLQRLLAGAQRRVQAALGALDLAKEMASPDSKGVLAGCPAFGDAGSEGALGLCEPAAATRPRPVATE